MAFDGGMGMSEYNMSFGFLSRLNLEFLWLAESKSTKNLDQWCDALIILFSELFNYYKKQEQQTEDYHKLQHIKEEVADILRTREKNMNKKLFWEMIDFELGLRRVMKQNNMELKMSDDPRLAL